MKNLIVMLFVYLIITPIHAVTNVSEIDVVNNVGQSGDLAQTLLKYNNIRNEINAYIPQLNGAEMRTLFEESKALRAKMEKYPGTFKDRDLQNMDVFLGQVENALQVNENLDACEIDDKYDLAKRNISAVSNSYVLGQEKFGCSKLDQTAYSFPELNSITEVGTYLVKEQMARSLFENSINHQISYYFDALDRYGMKEGRMPSLKKVLEETCDDDVKYCVDEVTKAYKEKAKMKNDLLSFEDLGEFGQQEMVDGINSQVTKINDVVEQLKKTAKKNDSLLTVGGNDFLIPCDDDADPEVMKLYGKYRHEVENLVTPTSLNQKDKIRSELATNMLYTAIGKPAVPETACDENGMREITFDLHEKIDNEDLVEAAETMRDKAGKILKTEQNDYDAGDDVDEYIGKKSHYTPHLLGELLNKNPEATQLICDGLKDFQDQENFENNVQTAATVLSVATAVTGVGGLALLGVRGALWGASRAKGLDWVRNSGVARFSEKGANRLLNSKGALLGYGGATIADSSALAYLWQAKKEDIAYLESNILAMPESQGKDKLYEEFVKAKELEFELKLSLSLGVFDVMGLATLVKGAKLSKGITEQKALALADEMKAKREILEAIKNDPQYDVLEGLRRVLPEKQYKEFIAQLTEGLGNKPKDLSPFATSLKINIDKQGDILKGIDNTVSELKLTKVVRTPKGTEINRTILDGIPASQRVALKVDMETKYADLIKKHGFDGPGYEEDMASVLHIIRQKMKNENIPWSKEKDVMDQELGSLKQTYCAKK